jgi:hypothetical protein
MDRAGCLAELRDVLSFFQRALRPPAPNAHQTTRTEVREESRDQTITEPRGGTVARLPKGGTEDEAPLQYVTLDQAAALVNRSKKTLYRYLNKPGSSMPQPDVEGLGGKAHEWRWSILRPWLEQEFGKKLPEKFPSRR